MNIHQYHSGTHPRDAITNSMRLIARKLAGLGIDGKIMAEHIDPELEGRVIPFDPARLAPEDILLVHHSFHNGLLDAVLAAPCRKVCVYHNITKPAFFGSDDPLREAAISGYEQLWQIKEAVDGAVCDSDFNAAGLIARGFENVTTICLLKDFEKLPSLESMGAPYHHEEDVFHILFVGRICPNKGQHHLIRAIPKLEARLGRRLKLTLCGHADHGSEYLQMVQKLSVDLGVFDRVHLAGSVSDEALRGFYREADAYVSMSQHEGFGVPLIEAMAMGTPVFAYGCTAIPDTMGEAGRVLKSRDADTLADAILEVFRTRSTRRAFIRKQRARACALSIDATFPALLAYLHGLYGDAALAATDTPGEVTEAGRSPVGLLYEGPLAGHYSLSLVNRNLSAALHANRGFEVSAVPREGTDAYDFDTSEVDRSPALLDVLYRKIDLTRLLVGLRNMYPPRTRGHVADLRLHYLYWEESRLPVPIVRQINSQLDGILAPTRYCEKVYRDSGVTVPIRTIGSGLVMQPDAGTPAQTDTPRPDGAPFTFLHVSSGLARKGVEELLRAYTRAFTAADNVTLLIKTYANPSNVIPRLVSELFEDRHGAPDLIVSYDDMDDAELMSLYRMADAVVLPTRGEGFNLPAAEALLAGKPLLVTDTGAHRDFCDAGNAVLLKSTFAPSRSHLAEKGSYWAVVDIDDLVLKMKQVRDGALSPEARLDYDAKDWNVVAENIESFVNELETERPVKETIRLASISTYNSRCGIAAYAATITDGLGPLYEIEHWANETAPIATHLETPRVHRLWKNLNEGAFRSLAARAVEQGFDAVLVQFNFGFFALDDLCCGLAHLREHGVLSYVAFHKTADTEVKGKTASLSAHVADLAQIDRIFVHSVDDVNYLATLGLKENVTLTPLAIPDMPALSATALRTSLGLGVSGPIIATNGFLLPNKGVPALITAFAEVRSAFPDARLILATAEFENSASAQLVAQCTELITLYGLEGQVTFITDFLSLDQIHILLSAADLIVYPYGYSQESASASIRQGLAAGRPILGTDSPIFASTAEAIEVMPHSGMDGLGARILELLNDTPRLTALREKVARFVKGQLPQDIALIIMANIQQDIAARDGVELPLLVRPPGVPRSDGSRAPVLARSEPQLLLEALLGRLPTPEEIRTFSDIYENGGTIAKAFDDLLGSDDYFKLVEENPQQLECLRLPIVHLPTLLAKSGSAFIEAAYHDILGREADAGGLENFLGVLESAPGEIGKRQVIAALIDSDEYRNTVVPRLVLEA